MGLRQTLPFGKTDAKHGLPGENLQWHLSSIKDVRSVEKTREELSMSAMDTHEAANTVVIRKTLSGTRKLHPPSEALGFGKYFTDHMLTISYKNNSWQTPEITPYQNFSLDPASSVLHYGQALFEGMKAFRQESGKVTLFRPDYNCRRMNLGAHRLCMPTIPKSLFENGIKELIRVDSEWVPNEPHCSLYVRPTMIGTEGFLGVRPSDEYIFFAILSPVGSYYGQGMQAGVKIWIEEDFVRAAPGGLGATKAAANYANSLYAAHEAKKRGFAQVLWLDVSHQFIEEVGTMNVFFKLEDKIITPPLGGTILAGGVRDSAIQLLQDWNIPVEERPVTLKEIQDAARLGTLKEIFGTGTAAVITAVEELHMKNGENIILPQKGMGPVSQRLFDTLNGIQRGIISDKYGWLVHI
jgi:branched-chain amino acid aminotransferase